MTDQSFALAVVAVVAVVNAIGLVYCVKILARERDHLIVRNGGDLARVEKARHTPPPSTPRVGPSSLDIWSHDLSAEQLEMMGDGELVREREPMVEGMNGL